MISQTQVLLAANAPRFRSAIRKLQESGVAALKPSLGTIPSVAEIVANNNNNDTTPGIIQYKPHYDRRIWHKPVISNRKAAVLRKQAIINQTYGTFDATTGVGWDAQWDIAIQESKSQGVGRVRITKPKLTKRFRTREDRAQKIEQKLIGMDERIEEVYVERQKSKPPQTFENTYKELMKVKK